MSIDDFDTNVFKLGKLCNHNHDYQGTGQSLRYVKGACDCRACTVIKREKYRSTEKWEDTRKAYSSIPSVRKKLAESVRQYRQKFREIHPDSSTFIGNLCLNEHRYQSSEQSLRHTSTGRCVQCKINESRRGYYKDVEATRQRNNEKRKEFYRLNREFCCEQSRIAHAKARAKMTEEERQIKIQASREYYKANRLRIRISQSQKYYSDSDFRESVKAKVRAWEKTEQGRLCKTRTLHRRRAREKDCHKYFYSVEQVNELKNKFNNLCAYCGKENSLSLDHFIPIACGGSDTLGNLIPCCRSCNSSKQHSDAKVWYEKQKFYSKTRWKKIVKHLGVVTQGQIPLL